MKLREMERDALIELQQQSQEKYSQYQAEGLNLDLTRGKPSTEQLDLSNSLDAILNGNLKLADGSDARNYGGLAGIPEARQLGAVLLDVEPSQVIVGGNSSLTFMYQYISSAFHNGVAGPGSSWQEESDSTGVPVRFLCLVPGYDRHFTICEHFGIEMINVEFTDDGPDMDQIEALVSADPMIKGIWCVPKYSNPTGHTYTPDVVTRMAGLGRIAGKNFRIMWDNAYAVHFLGERPADLASIYAECTRAGTEDNVVITGSTSKVTFAGSGISFLGSSDSNLAEFQKYIANLTIGPDKLNQLRHVAFLKDYDGILRHMSDHKAILKPKFDIVKDTLTEHLAGRGMGTWTNPEGGYFVSFDTLPGLAKRVVQLSAEAGVKLTPAGATYPYRQDKNDSNIRLSPTFPNLEDLAKAMEVFVVCVRLASVNMQLND